MARAGHHQYNGPGWTADRVCLCGVRQHRGDHDAGMPATCGPGCDRVPPLSREPKEQR